MDAFKTSDRRVKVFEVSVCLIILNNDM